MPAAGSRERRRSRHHRRRVLHGRRHRGPAQHRPTRQAVRGPGHGGRRPRSRHHRRGRPRHRQSFRPRAGGGRVHGHLLQVPGQPGRVHGRGRASGGLRAPQLPALHLLRLHPARQLRHSPGGPAVSGSASGAAEAARRPQRPFPGCAEGSGSGHPGEQDPHRAHLHLSGGADAAHRQGPVRERRLREHGPAPRRPGGSSPAAPAASAWPR